MFVYFHWGKSGGQHVQAFHKADKAAEYVINQIEALALDEGKNLGLNAKKKASRPYGGHHHDDDLGGDIGGAFNQPEGQVVAAAADGGIDWGHWNPPPVPVPVGAVPVAGAVRVVKKEEAKEARKIPLELLKLRDHMEIAKKDKTFENAVKAIQLYEDFLKYGLATPCDSSIHTLTDLKIVE